MPTAISWLLGLKLLFLVSLTTLVGVYVVLGLEDPRSIAAVILFGVLLGWLLTAPHWRTWRARARLTADDAAAFYFGSLELGESGRARMALANHPLAAKRHEGLGRIWRAVNPWGFATHPTMRVAIGHVAQVTDGVALIAISVLLTRRTGGTLFGFGSYYRTVSSSFQLRKLAIRRRGRWYLVNGLPTDSLDQALAERLRAGV